MLWFRTARFGAASSSQSPALLIEDSLIWFCVLCVTLAVQCNSRSLLLVCNSSSNGFDLRVKVKVLTKTYNVVHASAPSSVLIRLFIYLVFLLMSKMPGKFSSWVFVFPLPKHFPPRALNNLFFNCLLVFVHVFPLIWGSVPTTLFNVSTLISSPSFPLIQRFQTYFCTKQSSTLHIYYFLICLLS